jgi:hypothetical protein
LGLISGPGDSPTIRVWYADRTLKVHYLTEYSPRAAGEHGPDYYFAADGGRGLIEITRGPGPLQPALARNPVWQAGQNELAMLLAAHGEWRDAMAGFVRLLEAEPGTAGYAHNIAACYQRLGQPDSAALWLQRSFAIRQRPRTDSPGGP